MRNYEEIQDELKRCLPTLPKTLHTVASYMLDHPGEIAILPMRRLAESSGVAVPNFDRLAKRLGFGTYGELRQVYRYRIQDQDGGDYHRRAERLQRTAQSIGDDNLRQEFHRAALDSITRVYDTITTTDIVTVAIALETCPRIYVIGAQGSRSFAAYLNYIGRMASSKFSIPEQDGGLIADQMVDVTPKDAFIIISTQPCAKVAIDTARFARERGCLVVGVGDSHASPLARYTDHLLLTPTDGPMFFGSFIGKIAIIELLIGFIASRKNGHTVDRIKRIEESRARFGESWHVVD